MNLNKYLHQIVLIWWKNIHFVLFHSIWKRFGELQLPRNLRLWHCDRSDIECNGFPLCIAVYGQYKAVQLFNFAQSLLCSHIGYKEDIQHLVCCIFGSKSTLSRLEYKSLVLLSGSICLCQGDGNKDQILIVRLTSPGQTVLTTPPAITTVFLDQVGIKLP